MKNVGSFQKRNDAFAKKYNREIIISETIKKKIPVIFDVGSHFGESYKLFKIQIRLRFIKIYSLKDELSGSPPEI